VEFIGERAMAMPFPFLQPSPWSGWPSEWSTPNWAPLGSVAGINRLVDIAWACIDLNSSVLASFAVYRLKNGQIQPPLPYMFNPDPSIYTSWSEFAKQLFWDYQLGEAFVLPMATYSNGLPMKFRVIPPWLVNVELCEGVREYKIGSLDVTDEILHIRNISNTADAHGHCALESAGARMVTASLLERYAKNLAETGGVPHHWLDVPGRKLDRNEAIDLLDQWVESRARHAGGPGVLSGGVTLNQAQSMSARDLALLELSQFNESRIAILLGVPPFLVALPMAQGESITYSNASTVFDFHDRSSLRPKAVAVMNAMSDWLLPNGQSIELNRDDYSRPGYLERAQANQIYIETGVLQPPEVRAMERFDGVPSATASLTGAETAGDPTQSMPVSEPTPTATEEKDGF
jgi:HK97 family phage portal protein